MQVWGPPDVGPVPWELPQKSLPEALIPQITPCLSRLIHW